MAQEKNLIEYLRSRGYRLTHQRRVVFEVLSESQEHLDAEMVFSRARARDPRISLATVYRSLALLKEAGLVEEHRLGEDHWHFEAIQSTQHYHFNCESCGRVIEFESSSIQEAVARLSQYYGFHVTDVRFNLAGLCTSCQTSYESSGAV